jgi:hypothetical protein
VTLEAGKTYTILVEFGTLPTSALRNPGATQMGAGGLRIGCMRKRIEGEEIWKAVELAKTVDQVVVCAGLNVSPANLLLHPLFSPRAPPFRHLYALTFALPTPNHRPTDL